MQEIHTRVVALSKASKETSSGCSTDYSAVLLLSEVRPCCPRTLYIHKLESCAQSRDLTDFICTPHMHLHNQIPIGIRHVLEADVPEDTSIINQDIYPPEALNGRLDDCIAILDAIVIGNGFPAARFDLVDDNICGLYSERFSKAKTNFDGQPSTFEDWPSPLKLPPRSLTTTFAPLDPKKVAYALPKPPPAPVTTTVCPSKRSWSAIVIEKG